MYTEVNSARKKIYTKIKYENQTKFDKNLKCNQKN